MTIGGRRITTTKDSPERLSVRQTELHTERQTRFQRPTSRPPHTRKSPLSRAASSVDTVRSPSPRESQLGGKKNKGGNLAPLISALLLAAAATSLRIEEKRKRKDIRSSTSKTRSRTR